VSRDVNVTVLVAIPLSVFGCLTKSWPRSRAGGPCPRFGTGGCLLMRLQFLTSRSSLEACHAKLPTSLSGPIGLETVLRE